MLNYLSLSISLLFGSLLRDSRTFARSLAHAFREFGRHLSVLDHYSRLYIASSFRRLRHRVKRSLRVRPLVLHFRRSLRTHSVSRHALEPAEKVGKKVQVNTDDRLYSWVDSSILYPHLELFTQCLSIKRRPTWKSLRTRRRLADLQIQTSLIGVNSSPIKSSSPRAPCSPMQLEIPSSFRGQSAPSLFTRRRRNPS